MIENRRIAKVKDIIGKTVKAYSEAYCDDLIISFTDGTYFVVSCDGEDDSAWLEMGGEITPRSYDIVTLTALFGREDAATMVEEEKARIERLREESRKRDLKDQRAQYEQLKKIFEPQS